MKTLHKKFLFIALIVLVFLHASDGFAQCAMCKAVPTSNLEGGGTIANGLNTGILYLMSIPYILVMGFVVYYYREKINAFYKNKFYSVKK